MSIPDIEMIDTDQIRIRQEQRLVFARRAVDEAREQLKSALALVETRERECEVIQEDVEQKLAALELVISMACDSDDPAGQAKKKNSELPGEGTLPESLQTEMKTEGTDSGDDGSGRRSLIPKRVIIRWRPILSDHRPTVEPGDRSTVGQSAN